jgi:CubicO group peptidase (beta-lactamase class C family)
MRSILRRSRGVAAVKNATPPDGPLSADAVDELLRAHNVPGASIAVIEHGTVTAAYAYGTAQGTRAVDQPTRFQAASISKFINALGVLKLVQAGRLGLDDPVNRHLTSWRVPENELTATAAVTLRMLLNHSGGTTVDGFPGYLRTDVLPNVVQILDGLAPANTPAVRVVKPPGEAYIYSGGGTTVLQQLVMDVTDMAYEEALQQLVLRPLGMAESSFEQPPIPELIERSAFGHARDGRQISGGFRLHPEQAAAGLWTTPRDLCKALLAVIRSYTGEPNSFLGQALARAMLTRGLGQAGLGIFITDPGGFYHGGSNVGFRALCGASPARRRGFVVMANGDNGDPICIGLRQRIVEAYPWT